MAKIINLDKAHENYSYALGFWDVAVAIQRGNATPLDKSSYFATLSEAKTYASTDVTAYVGQIISVLDNSENGDGTGNVTAYIISDAEGTLIPLASGSGKADVGISAMVVEVIKHDDKFYEKTDADFKNPITDVNVNSENPKVGGEGVYVKLKLTDDVEEDTERKDVVYIKNTDIIDIDNYYTKSEIDEFLNVIDSSINTIEEQIVEIDSSLVDHEIRITDLENALDDFMDSSIVTTFKASTTTDFVDVTPTISTEGDVEMSVDLTLKKAENNETYVSTGIATDGYVDEKLGWIVVEDDLDTIDEDTTDPQG